ncbi:TPA: hypothetical protein ACXNP3_004073, partial [Escherichia coli]
QSPFGLSAEEVNDFLDSFIMPAHIVGADNTKDKRWGSSFLALFSGVKNVVSFRMLVVSCWYS